MREIDERDCQHGFADTEDEFKREPRYVVFKIKDIEKIETTDVDVEATAWAIATLEALHVGYMSDENAAMMERLRKMTGA